MVMLLARKMISGLRWRVGRGTKRRVTKRAVAEMKTFCTVVGCSNPLGLLRGFLLRVVSAREQERGEGQESMKDEKDEDVEEEGEGEEEGGGEEEGEEKVQEEGVEEEEEEGEGGAEEGEAQGGEPVEGMVKSHR